MSVVRIKKRENPYVQIDKRCLEDKRLSWRAKGILAYLLSKPDGWNVIVKDIWHSGREGRNAVQDCLAELQKFGYAELVTKQSENGVFAGSEWVITEEPKTGFSDDSDKPEIGKPTNRKSGSRLHSNNTVDSNNENTNNNHTAAKPPNDPKNKIETDQNLNERHKKQNGFNGRGSAKKSDGGEVSEVVKFLNETVKPACNFRETSKTTAAHIRQRIAEGFTVSDICIVIEHKNMQWRNDPKMSEYLRPATLFGTGKFEAYLIAARTWENGGKKSPQNSATYQNQTRSVTTDFGGDKSKFEQPQVF